MLTGNRDTDFLILNQLKDYELTRVCQVNRIAQKICNDDTFWMNRVLTTFGPYLGSAELIRTKYLGDRTWQEYYIYLKKQLNSDIQENLGKFVRMIGGVPIGNLDPNREEDLIKLLRIKKDNNRKIASSNNLEKLKKLFAETEDFLIDKRIAYYTSKPEILSYLLANKILPSPRQIDYIVGSKNYDNIRELYKNSKIDPIYLMSRIGDEEIRNIAVETGRLTASQMFEVVQRILYEKRGSLDYDQLYEVYKILK